MSAPVPTINAKQMSIVTNIMSEKDNASSDLTEKHKKDGKKSSQNNLNLEKSSSRFENNNMHNY